MNRYSYNTGERHTQKVKKKKIDERNDSLGWLLKCLYVKFCGVN